MYQKASIRLLTRRNWLYLRRKLLIFFTNVENNNLSPHSSMDNFVMMFTICVNWCNLILRLLKLKHTKMKRSHMQSQSVNIKYFAKMMQQSNVTNLVNNSEPPNLQHGIIHLQNNLIKKDSDQANSLNLVHHAWFLQVLKNSYKQSPTKTCYDLVVTKLYTWTIVKCETF